MKRKTIFTLSLVLSLLLLHTLVAQEDKVVTFQVHVQPPEIARGGKGTIHIRYEIAEGYHISDASSGIFQVSPKPAEGIEYQEPGFPQPEEDDYGKFHSGAFSVQIPFQVKSSASPGSLTLLIETTVQPCSEEGGICYPPESHEVKGAVEILSNIVESNTSPPSSNSISDRVSRALEQGSILAFLFVFIGGILTSLTPCVYPMIPITIAVIGAQATGGKLRGFVLSLFYVLGLAVTFSTLGLIAARTGALFGSHTQHPGVILFVATVFLLMGLSLLGAFVIQMPSSLASKFQGKKRSGFGGVFLTGLLAGLVASPCISPILVVILAWVAKSGSVILGVGLLFSFSLGLGVLFVLIGTFSGILKNLPKSGGWMEIIERGFGVLLVVLAIVFVRPLLQPFIYQMVWAVFLIVLGTFVGAFAPLEKESSSKTKLGKAMGVIAILLGTCLFFFGMAGKLGWQQGAVISQNHEELYQWIPDDEEGFRQSEISQMPVLIDFYADWCRTCKELDEKTWPDPEVQTFINQYVLVKLDLTKNDEITRAYKTKYNVIGPPTVILFDVAKNEIVRFEGFKPPGEVIPFLQKGL